MHLDAANKAAAVLSNFSEISKIVLFGSVAKQSYGEKSDIDLGIIIDDSLKALILDLEGLPTGFRQKVEASLRPLQSQTGLKFHTPIYFLSEYGHGIELYSGRSSPPDLLHKAGIIIYDVDESQEKIFRNYKRFIIPLSS